LRKIGKTLRSSFIRHALVALVMFILSLSAILSQETNITASVDSTEIGDQDQLQLIVEVSGKGSGKVKGIAIPPLKNLAVVAGPSVSTRFQWINGVSSSSKNFTYVLIPREVGEALIPPITVTLDGKKYETKPLKIKVTQGTRQRKPEKKRPSFPDRFGRGPRAEKAETEVFVQAAIDKKKVYQGEGLILTYKAYSSEPIIDVDAREMPSYEGFWVEDLGVDPNPRIIQKNGKKYNEYTLIRKLLFPSTPGKKTIEPLTFAIAIRESSGDIFENFFGRGTRRIYRQTDLMILEALSLPERGQPDDFTGIVGDFTVSMEVDKKECSVNDAINVEVTVEGYGNLKGLSPIKFEDVSDFKIYEPEVVEESRFEGKKLKSRKAWKYIFVPLTPGEHEIPSIRFSYFNPTKGIYESRQTDPQAFIVKKGPIDLPSVSSSIPKGEITPLRRDIHFIKSLKGDITDRGEFIYRKGWFYLLLVLPFLLTPLMIGFSLRREKIKTDAGAVRVRKAFRNASKGLRKANRLLKKGDMSSSLQETSRSMAGYIAAKFNLSPSGLTYERMEEILEDRGVSEETIRNFRMTLEKCDFTRFSKSPLNAERVSQLLKEAEQAILTLEKIF
jgi:hypothetical protein